MVNDVSNGVEAQANIHSNENGNIGDTLETKYRRLVAGVVVWAKVNGFPMWPAVIRARSHVMATLKEEERNNLPPSQPNTRVVEFFNDDNNIAVVDVANMDLFTSDVRHLSRAGSALRTIISEACDEAETFVRACGLPFQRAAISDETDFNRPKAAPQIIALGAASESGSSSEEDLDMPLAIVHSGKAAPGAPILKRPTPTPPKVYPPSQPKTHAMSNVNELGNDNNVAGSVHPSTAGPLKTVDSPRLVVDEEDIIGPTPEGHPPWTTPLSILSRASPPKDGTESEPLVSAENGAASNKSGSLPMKLRLRGVASQEKRPSTETKHKGGHLPRSGSIGRLSSRQSKERHLDPDVIDEGHEGDVDENENELIIDDHPRNELRRRSREIGLNDAVEIESLKRTKRPRHDERQIEVKGCQDDIKFLKEQAGAMSEFAKRLTRVSTKYESLLEETSRLQKREAELKASQEEEEKNLQIKKRAAEAQDKLMDHVMKTLDKNRKEEKKVAEEVAQQKAILQQLTAELERYKIDVAKQKDTARKFAEEAKAQKELAQRFAEEAKLQKELADSHRAEGEELIVSHQKMQRRMADLQGAVEKLRDERRGLRKMSRELKGGGSLSSQMAQSLAPPVPQTQPPQSHHEKGLGIAQVIDAGRQLQPRMAPQAMSNTQTGNGSSVNTGELSTSRAGASSSQAAKQAGERTKTNRKEIIEAWGTRIGGIVNDKAGDKNKKG